MLNLRIETLQSLMIFSKAKALKQREIKHAAVSSYSPHTIWILVFQCYCQLIYLSCLLTNLALSYSWINLFSKVMQKMWPGD